MRSLMQQEKMEKKSAQAKGITFSKPPNNAVQPAPPPVYFQKVESHTLTVFLTFNCIKLEGKKYLIYYNKSIQNIKFFFKKSLEFIQV